MTKYSQYGGAKEWDKPFPECTVKELVRYIMLYGEKHEFFYTDDDLRINVVIEVVNVEDLSGWTDIHSQPLPECKEIDVKHTLFGVIEGCAYHPEYGRHPLVQDCARFRLDGNVTHWRYSERTT